MGKAFEVSCCLLGNNRCTEKVPTCILGMLLANLDDETKKRFIALGMGDPTAFSCFTTTNVAENPVVDALSSQKFNGYSPTICGCICLGRIYRKLKGLWNGLIGVLVNSWQMGQNDQRKAVSLAKMGLPLALISLLIFCNEPLSDISEHYVWDILIGFKEKEKNVSPGFKEKRIYRKLKGLWNGLIGVLVNSWQMGQNDQRKAVSLAKMGLPLALISLLIFCNEPLSDISEHFVCDILIGFFFRNGLIGEGFGEFVNVVKMVHGLVVLHGYEGETTVVNALITVYFGSGCFGEGRCVFVESGDRNVVT
ncbi:Aminotransferase, class I/classII [Artemisia annua]|uniref:Aminotransferase, class I/classII n=1 Tax=Artemisia annua TaxID=35608 RepID=A0A2U1Q4K0_ARTAN|nr:Aminotransferase, class I/classII [Artemisia annua]